MSVISHINHQTAMSDSIPTPFEFFIFPRVRRCASEGLYVCVSTKCFFSKIEFVTLRAPHSARNAADQIKERTAWPDTASECWRRPRCPVLIPVWFIFSYHSCLVQQFDGHLKRARMYQISLVIWNDNGSRKHRLRENMRVRMETTTSSLLLNAFQAKCEKAKDYRRFSPLILIGFCPTADADVI